MAELLHWDEVTDQLDAVRAALDDPKTLQPYAKRRREKTKKWIESQGGGSWAPFAESTLKKMEAEGSSDITKHGDIRAAKIKKVEGQLRKLAAQTGKKGFSDKDRAKVGRLKKRLILLRKKQARPATLQQKADLLKGQLAEAHVKLRDTQRAKKKRKGAEERAQKRIDKLSARWEKAEHEAKHAASYKNRDVGEKTSEKRDGRMMPNMARTIRTKLHRVARREIELVEYSKSGIVGLAHDQGLGNDPQRKIMCPVDSDDLAFVVDLIEGKCMKAWEGK